MTCRVIEKTPDIDPKLLKLVSDFLGYNTRYVDFQDNVFYCFYSISPNNHHQENCLKTVTITDKYPLIAGRTGEETTLVSFEDFCKLTKEEV